jgi:hypothetical protein
MEILEAYDLAGTLRGAPALVGCHHKTIAHRVRMREQTGGMARRRGSARRSAISRGRSKS